MNGLIFERNDADTKKNMVRTSTCFSPYGRPICLYFHLQFHFMAHFPKKKTRSHNVERVSFRLSVNYSPFNITLVYVLSPTWMRNAYCPGVKKEALNV